MDDYKADTFMNNLSARMTSRLQLKQSTKNDFASYLTSKLL